MSPEGRKTVGVSVIGPARDGGRLPFAPTGMQRRLATLLVITGSADWLLYGHRPGISVVILMAILAVGVCVANPVEVSRRRAIGAAGVLILALGPLIEDFSVIGLLFGAIGTAYFALAVTVPASGGFAQRMFDAVRLLPTGPAQCVTDLCRQGKAGIWRRLWATSTGTAAAWLLPLCLGGVFLGLFALANPLIANRLAAIQLLDAIGSIDFGRVVFWLAIGLAIWPIIFRPTHSSPRARAGSGHPPPAAGGTWARRLDGAVVLRSLLLFNALFLVETVLDLTYLWAGVALPGGMSHASYAHRGAYPLIVTALLAGGFVMIAIRPGRRDEPPRLVRGLLQAWILQNILLVVSALIRLKSYVDFYSLTYWRVAAFIWMGLVAVGLVLLVLRIACGLSNAWLIRSNGAATAAVLYACCLVHFPAVIAAYNVAHCREVSGEGHSLDKAYLRELGPEIIPVMDEYRRRHPEAYRMIEPQFDRQQMAASFTREPSDWREWSLRRWRLARYLAH